MEYNLITSFNDIYIAYYKKSFLYVKSYVHDEMAAEDIVTDALIKLWKEMKKTTIDPIRPYLFTLLKNQMLDYLKHQTIKRGAHEAITQALNRELEQRTTTLESSDPTDVFSAELQQIIEATLKCLPEKTRDIFILSRFGNKPHKEIAQLFNISVKGIDYHILHSVKELRATLKDYLPLIGTVTFLE